MGLPAELGDGSLPAALVKAGF